MPKKMHSQDIITHHGEEYGRYEGAIVPPIYQSSLFVRPTKSNNIKEHHYSYTRAANPTIEVLEKKLAALEHGEAARCFSSGMAAISAAILAHVQAGCHVVTIKNVYSGTRALLEKNLPAWCGVSTSFVAGSDARKIMEAVTDKTSLIYLESPSTGVFELQDLSLIADFARSKAIATVIDNTWATPLFQNPLEMGIDVVVHSASKYLGGHSDVVAGVAISNQETCHRLEQIRSILGACLDPNQAFLLTRGLRTLGLRLQEHEKTAHKLARFLEDHPKVDRVYWPGLPSYAQKELALRQLKGSSGLMSLVLKDAAQKSQKFIDSLKIFQHACSWGGYESLVLGLSLGLDKERSARLGLPPQLIRLHAGLEHSDTLLADLDQALAGL